MPKTKESDKPKDKKKRTVTKETTAKRSAARKETAIVNQYLTARKKRQAKAGSGKTERNIEERIKEIDETLARGSKEKRVPKGKIIAGQKRESVVKPVPLRPTEIAKLMKEREQLQRRLEGGPRRRTAKADRLHEEFLRVLPGWARRMGYNREILLAMGVTEEELHEASV